MCGRFTQRTPPDLVALLFEVVGGMDAVQGMRPRSNVCPTTQVLCIRETPVAGDDDVREFFAAKWGLIPSWAKDAKFGAQCINARSETVDTKPAFRSAFKKRRCIVVADGFYEWRKTDKQPFYVSLRSEKPMPFAGLWETWNSPDGAVLSCTICTMEANELMGTLHDRMPVILPPEAFGHWLDPALVDPAEVRTMLRQYPSDLMQAWPVSKRVGNVQNEGADLTDRIDIPEV